MKAERHKRYEPSERDRKLVELATALGGTQQQIASSLKITRPTLIKYFRKELDDGLFNANLSVGMNLYRKAMSGDNTCMLFWLKCRAGWRETDRLELTGSDGQPFNPIPIVVNFTDKKAVKGDDGEDKDESN